MASSITGWREAPKKPAGRRGGSRPTHARADDGAGRAPAARAPAPAALDGAAALRSSGRMRPSPARHAPLRRPRAARVAAAFVLLAALAGTGCGERPVTDQAAVCVPANDQSTQTIVGYVKVPGFTLAGSDRFPVQIVEQMDKDGRSIRASVAIGTGPNQIEPLGESFEMSQIKVHTADGHTKGYGAWVAMTGKLSVSEDFCMLSVDTVATPAS